MAGRKNPPNTVASPATIPSEARPLLMKLRILIADDNGPNRTVALGQVRELGYAAEAVADGSEVEKALEQVPYDVILMDCQMPEAPSLPRVSLSLASSLLQIGRGSLLGMDSVRWVKNRTATIAAANPDAAPTPSAQRGPK
jgi:CheY-like chemotaxis protein